METELIKRLEEFIKEKGWNKADFARNMGIFPQHVNRYFNGKADIQKIFVKLSEYGCDLNWLATGIKTNQYGYADKLLLESKVKSLELEKIIFTAKLEEKQFLIDTLLRANYELKNDDDFLSSVKNF